MFKKPFAPLHKKDPERYRYLLWLKFVICNFAFAAMFALGFLQGWVGLLFGKKDGVSWLATVLTFDTQTTYVTAMSGVFLIGLLISIQKVFLTSREINFLKEEHPSEFSRVAEYLSAIRGADSGSRANLHHLLEEKWYSRISTVGYLAGILVLLGLLGTVLGFVIALSGVVPSMVGDVSAVGGMVATLVKGMGVALYTTLAGGIFGGLWLDINARILKVGGSDFLTLLGERGEEQEKAHTNTDVSCDPQPDVLAEYGPDSTEKGE